MAFTSVALGIASGAAALSWQRYHRNRFWVGYVWLSRSKIVHIHVKRTGEVVCSTTPFVCKFVTPHALHVPLATGRHENVCLQSEGSGIRLQVLFQKNVMLRHTTLCRLSLLSLFVFALPLLGVAIQTLLLTHSKIKVTISSAILFTPDTDGCSSLANETCMPPETVHDSPADEMFANARCDCSICYCAMNKNASSAVSMPHNSIS